MSATALATIGGALTGLLDTGFNAGMVYQTNRQNERLMRESWAREDTAVQRRVADLKAAGLSPTLAAGSAAASSGPITLKSPQIDSSGAFNNALAAASAVKALKHQELENDIAKKQAELLDKQIDYYGLPDWYVGGIRMFGADGFKDFVQNLGEKFFSSFSGPSVINNINDSLKSGIGNFPFAFTPKESYTSTPSSSVPSAVEESLEGFNAKSFVDDDGAKTIVFDTREDARKWFLSIGGTTNEWYYGVRKYGSPDAFLDEIIGTGLWYFKEK